MRTDQIRKEIVEFLGWTEVEHRPDAPHHFTYGKAGGLTGRQPNLNFARVPDLDLNIMGTAEEKLSDFQRRRFAMTLHEISNADYSFGRPENYWIVAHAPASQRAEALLRTLGKWA